MKSGVLLFLVGLLSFWNELTFVSGQPEICLLRPDPGPCKAHMPRYFYDTSSKKCKEFIYGGCKGNKNNFKKLAKCQETCERKPGICPKNPPGVITTCDVTCQSDWDCPESYKCCHRGCRIACFPPA